MYNICITCKSNTKSWFNMQFNSENKKDKFEALSNPYMHDLYKHIKIIVKNPTMADDVFQNTLLIAFEKLETLRSESKFKSWIFKISTNECFKTLKKSKKELPIDEFFDDVEALKDSNTAELLTIVKENKKSVMKAVSKLSYEQRRLIFLIYYLELDYKKISEILSLSTNVLRVRHHRIIKKLKEILKGEI